MIFFELKAHEHARERIAGLASGKSSDIMLFAAAKKIGIEKVAATLGARGGVMERNFDRCGRYVLDIDDIRRCIHSLRSVSQMAEQEAQRFSFA